jgi:F0F1-type ATP synthase membrane subunit b/b'
MATLNLIPNPVVLGAQIGVFLVNYAVVKKLFVEPYLTVRARRNSLTVGSQEEATNAAVESDKIAKLIESRFVACAADAKSQREGLRERAQTDRDGLLAKAEAEAKSVIAEVERRIRDELATERAKVPEVINSLSEQLYQQAVN